MWRKRWNITTCYDCSWQRKRLKCWKIQQHIWDLRSKWWISSFQVTETASMLAANNWAFCYLLSKLLGAKSKRHAKSSYSWLAVQFRGEKGQLLWLARNKRNPWGYKKGYHPLLLLNKCYVIGGGTCILLKMKKELNAGRWKQQPFWNVNTQAKTDMQYINCFICFSSSKLESAVPC